MPYIKFERVALQAHPEFKERCAVPRGPSVSLPRPSAASPAAGRIAATVTHSYAGRPRREKLGLGHRANFAIRPNIKGHTRAATSRSFRVRTPDCASNSF